MSTRFLNSALRKMAGDDVLNAEHYSSKVSTLKELQVEIMALEDAYYDEVVKVAALMCQVNRLYNVVPDNLRNTEDFTNIAIRLRVKGLIHDSEYSSQTDFQNKVEVDLRGMREAELALKIDDLRVDACEILNDVFDTSMMLLRLRRAVICDNYIPMLSNGTDDYINPALLDDGFDLWDVNEMKKRLELCLLELQNIDGRVGVCPLMIGGIYSLIETNIQGVIDSINRCMVMNTNEGYVTTDRRLDIKLSELRRITSVGGGSVQHCLNAVIEALGSGTLERREEDLGGYIDGLADGLCDLIFIIEKVSGSHEYTKEFKREVGGYLKDAVIADLYELNGVVTNQEHYNHLSFWERMSFGIIAKKVGCAIAGISGVQGIYDDTSIDLLDDLINEIVCAVNYDEFD